MTGTQRAVSPYAFLKRDSDRERQMAQQASVQNQSGKVLVTAGTSQDESTVLIAFANVFVEEPLFTFGSVLDSTSSAVPGSYPTASATVHRWSLVTFGPASFYGGAFVGIVTTGVVGQNLWIHYNFMGKALNYGLGGSPTVGQATA